MLDVSQCLLNAEFCTAGTQADIKLLVKVLLVHKHGSRAPGAMHCKDSPAIVFFK